MRHVGPMRNPGMGHIFLHANQGKRSIVLDLKQPPGREAALRLAERSDVLISNVRPQALARLGLDYAAVRERNARIIHVSCCGFDQEGPYAARPAYDDLIQGATGIPWLMQQYGAQAPCYAPVTLADRVTGLHAVYAVTAALFARERSGEGQAVVVPMFEAMTQFVLADHMAGLTFEPADGAAGYPRLLTPHRRPYRTQDGYLCVLIYNDKHWRSFFAAIGEPERMAGDSRFATHGARAANIDAVYEEVGRIMAQRTTAQWRALLDRADVPNMPMNSPEDLLDDPHHNATGFIRTVEHHTEGRLRTTGCPTRWSGTPPPADTLPAPRLGEHSVAILQELGYSQSEIGQMLGSGACLAGPQENTT
jgi:crotonobetainyl-CoA:carnitine CoA-transferase CaiB-like acyl-CoA transferase